MLSNSEMMRLAPSIFAQTPASSRSDKYTFIPTIHAVEALRNEGFFPTSVKQTKSRSLEGRSYARHIVRLRRQSDLANPLKVGDSLPEIVLMNSHDGTSSFQLSAGVFRLVCSNGMIIPESCIGTIKTRHKGDIINDVIEGSYSIIEQSSKAFERIENFQSLNVEMPMQLAYAKAASLLKWDEGTAPVEPHQLLGARRVADTKNDLWTTFNRVQENLIRGGLVGRSASNRRVRTRPVRAIAEDTRLNKALWSLTEEMAELLA